MVNRVLCNGRNRIVRDGNRNGDAGDGEQENGIGLENGNGGRGAGGRGTGEQDWAGEREWRTRRGETRYRRTGFELKAQGWNPLKD